MRVVRNRQLSTIKYKMTIGRLVQIPAGLTSSLYTPFKNGTPLLAWVPTPPRLTQILHTYQTSKKSVKRQEKSNSGRARA